MPLIEHIYLVQGRKQFIGFLETLSAIAVEFLKVHHWPPGVFTSEVHCAHAAPRQAQAGKLGLTPDVFEKKVA